MNSDTTQNPARCVQPACSAFIVSVVMTRITNRGLVNTQNKLWWINAADKDEAEGKAVKLALSDYPEHQVHTVCSYRLTDSATEPNAIGEARAERATLPHQKGN